MPLLIGFFGVAGILLAIFALQKRLNKVRSIARGLLITYFMLLIIVVAGELYFRFVFAESENTVTDAALNWLARYWHTNSLGFRDREWTPADTAGKQTVLLTGDSFAAGWGIENTADRYGDVLAQHLGSNYAVINLGVYGTSTPEQLAILKKYPLQTPNVVIMQYFLNDIDYTLLKNGKLPNPEPEPSWVGGSYLMDFLYNRMLARFIDPLYNEDWWGINYAAYDNATYWNEHKQEIDDFVHYVDGMHARLIVVIFPNMLDPVRSIPYVDRVAQAIQATGHSDILKLFDQAAAWSLQDRIVSLRDTHPSVAFNHMVGDLLYQQFFQNPGQPQSSATSEPSGTAQPSATAEATQAAG